MQITDQIARVHAVKCVRVCQKAYNELKIILIVFFTVKFTHKKIEDTTSHGIETANTFPTYFSIFCLFLVHT